MDEISEVTAELIDGPCDQTALDNKGQVVRARLFGAGATGLVIRFELCRDGDLIRVRDDPIIVLHATEADAKPEAVAAEINRWIEKLHG